MANHEYKRRHFFVDRKVQGALLVRGVGYWAYCVVALTTIILTWDILTNPNQTLFESFREMWPLLARAIIASLILLPILAIDVVRFSNRFAGPIVRMRNTMLRAAGGEEVEPLAFRSDDYWHELSQAFNQFLTRHNARGTDATRIRNRHGAEGYNSAPLDDLLADDLEVQPIEEPTPEPAEANA